MKILWSFILLQPYSLNVHVHYVLQVAEWNYYNFFYWANNVADDDIVIGAESSNGGSAKCCNGAGEKCCNGAGATNLEDWKMNVASKIGCLEAEIRTLRMLVIMMCIVTIVAIIMCVLICLGKQ